jgi:uncharacterized protein
MGLANAAGGGGVRECRKYNENWQLWTGSDANSTTSADPESRFMREIMANSRLGKKIGERNVGGVFVGGARRVRNHYHDHSRSTTTVRLIMANAKNVLGGPLKTCSTDPLTGFYRDGCCNTGQDDEGLHTICCRVTAPFLAHQREIGNDLSTPFPLFGFPGLRPGDQWCVCITRWKESLEAGVACPVDLEATHMHALEFVDLEDLKRHAVKAPQQES